MPKRAIGSHACDGRERTPPMSETVAVFQAPMLWLNAAAPLNMLAMFDTDAVFHAPRFWLKADTARIKSDPRKSTNPSTGAFLSLESTLIDQNNPTWHTAVPVLQRT